MPSWLPTEVKTVICSKLEADLEGLLKSLSAIKTALSSDIQNIENLFNLPFKTVSDAMSDINSMINGLDAVVPDIHDLESLEAMRLFLERCLYLKEHPLLKDSFKMAQNLLDQYQEMATSYIQEKIDLIPSNILNHFDLGEKLLDYKDKLDRHGIVEKQSQVSQIFACMEAICALDEADDPIQDIQDYVNDQKNILVGLEDDMRFTSYGQMDIDKIYTNAGLNTDEKLIMGNTIDAVEHVVETFNEAQENLEAATKGDDLPYPNTDIYTHFNTPTFSSTSSLFDIIDPTIMYASDILIEWNKLQLPVGTTKKQGMLDVKIEIDAVIITETPDPNINCFGTYKTLIKIIIGFIDCSLSGNGSTTIVTQVNHGYTSGDSITISSATNDILEGDHTIVVIDDHTYSFTNTFNGTDEAKASYLVRTGEGEFVIGMPVCGSCGKYNTYGISSAGTEDLSYIRKHLSEAIKKSLPIAMSEFTATEIENLIPNR